MSRSHWFTLAFLCAAAARVASAEQSGPDQVRNETVAEQLETPDPSHEEDAKDDAPAAPGARESNDAESRASSLGADARSPEWELELNVLGSTRGEGALEALARGEFGRLSALIGTGNSIGAYAADREWLRGRLAWNFGVVVSLATLWQPEQSGASQEQLSLGVGAETESREWEVVLTQQRAQLSGAAAGLPNSLRGESLNLCGFSATLEFAHDVAAGLRANLHAAAGLFSLTLPRNALLPWLAISPWSRIGEHALMWPARAEGSLGLSLERAFGTASISLGAGLPAQAGGAEGELTLAFERPLGPATFSLAASAAHLWPNDLWLGSLTLGARWHFASG